MRANLFIAMSLLGFGLAAGSFAQTPSPAQPPEVASDSPALTQAKANLARVKTPAEVTSRIRPDYPETEKAAGNGGRVYVNGIVTVDGRFEETFVTRTSTSPVLTAAALTAARAAVFQPAKDDAGAPVAVPSTLSIEFSFGKIYSSFISWVEPVISDTARAAGMHGKVEVKGRIGADGHMRDVVVVVSSRAPELDDAAVAAAKATVFRAFTDGAGNPVEQPLSAGYEFDNMATPGSTPGIERYRCIQFARDQEWWRANWPDKKDEFYYLMSGMSFARSLYAPGADPLKPGAAKAFEARWDRTIEACKANPGALFLGVFGRTAEPSSVSAKDARPAAANQSWEDIKVRLAIKTKPAPDVAPSLCDDELPMFSEAKAAAVHIACFLRTAGAVNLDRPNPADTVTHGYDSWLAPDLYLAWHTEPALAIGIHDGFVPARIEDVSVGSSLGTRTVLFGCVISVNGQAERKTPYAFTFGGAPQRRLDGRKQGQFVNLVAATPLQAECPE